MHSGSDTSTAGQAAPPKVRVVLPTYEPGPWFDDVIESLAHQEYPALHVTVVHGEQGAATLPSQVSGLDDVTLVSSDGTASFGQMVNAVAEAADEPLLLMVHDDVAMEPGAVSALVKEWLRRRDDATMVGAKLLHWTNERALMPSGFVADRFGMTENSVNAGDLDQGQQDRITDSFGTSTACLLISREFFVSLGGFDEVGAGFGEDHDLALRARSVGGSVVISSDARARHRSGDLSRAGEKLDRRSRNQQMRSVLAAAPASSMPLILANFFALHIIEMVVAVLRFDVAELARIPAAWLWNLANIGSLSSRRALLTANENYDHDALQLVRQRGSLRLSSSFDRRIAEREVNAESGGSSTLSVIRGVGGICIAALLVFGGRRLFTSQIPTVGEFRAIPDDLGVLSSDWWSGLRTWGLGSDGFASFGLPLLDVAGTILGGSASLLEFVIIVAPIPIGVIGAWRLFHYSASDWAPVACALLYAASPLPYNAISGGSATALWLYAAMPWMFANVVAVAQPEGAALIMLGRRRSPAVATVALTLTLAILTAFNPFVLLIIVIFVSGLLIGSLLAGDMRGAFPILATSMVGLAGAAILNAPFLAGIRTWEQFARAGSATGTALPLTDILTMSFGPVGSPIFGWAVFAPAILPVLLGIGQKFTWAMRVWGAMLLSFAVAWLVVRGWMPVGMPVLELLLAPVALGFAVLGGLTAVTAEIDLRGARVRILFATAVAVVGIAVSGLPLLDVASSGRWELARVDLTTTLASLEAPPEAGSYRVVWVGDAHVLGAASIPTENELAWASSLDGVPDIRALWGGLDTAGTAALGDVIDAGLAGRTSRLGQDLAEFGVRYVVVVDQQAPVPEVSRRLVVSGEQASALNGQLDLVRDGVVNPAVAIYRNTAWAPVVSAIDPLNLGPLLMENMEPAVVQRVDHDTFRGQTRDGRDVFAAWQPFPQWIFTVDGQVAPRLTASENSLAFETASTPSLDAELSFETELSHRAIILIQAVGWSLLFIARRSLFSRERRTVRDGLEVVKSSEVVR